MIMKENRLVYQERPSGNLDTQKYTPPLSDDIGVELMKKPDIDVYPGVDKIHFDEAKKSLVTALKFIKNNVKVKDKDGSALNIDFDDISRYLALMHKETELNSNDWEKSRVEKVTNKNRQYGYFQIDYSAVKDIRNKYSFAADAKIWQTWGDNDYQYRHVSNCVYGILYLYKLRQDLDRKTNYKVLGKDEESKKKLNYMIYNQGAGRLNDLWNHFQPQNFKDFENKLYNQLASNLGKGGEEPGVSKQYNPNYIVEFDLDSRIHDWRASKKLSEEFVPGVIMASNRKIAEMLEYYKIVDAIISNFFIFNEKIDNKQRHVVGIYDDWNSLWVISRNYGVEIEDIKDSEGKPLPNNNIKKGQVLQIEI